jgi:hypothetical protein
MISLIRDDFRNWLPNINSFLTWKKNFCDFISSFMTDSRKFHHASKTKLTGMRDKAIQVAKSHFCQEELMKQSKFL